MGDSERNEAGCAVKKRRTRTLTAAQRLALQEEEARKEAERIESNFFGLLKILLVADLHNDRPV